MYFVDTGLLMALRSLSRTQLLADRKVYGAVLENFVFSELLKAVTSDDRRISLYHHREQQKRGVDFVLELGSQLVAIEVKASMTVKPDHYRNLKYLRDLHGENFVCGILLHDGDKVLALEDRLYAMPFHMLWNAASMMGP